MKPSKTIAGIIAGTSLVMGGVDASSLNEVPLERVEMVAENRVEARQIGNVVETTLPWKGEKGLKVIYDMGEPTALEKVKDKRKKQVITEVVDFGDGGFKVDVLLTEKPTTNQFCYAIEGAENYDFFYQSPATQAEIDEGMIQAPEIAGSYAVYHKTLKDHIVGQQNYATGKVMHIPRPQVWEMGNEANKVWADLSYSDGQLCVTAPQDFIDNADYTNGVRIDPTFGYTTLGASFNTLQADYIEASHYTLSEAPVTLTKVTVYLTTASNNFKGVVYSDSSAQPLTLIANSSGVAFPGSDGWVDATLSGSLSSTGEYWLGIDTQNGNGTVAFDDLAIANKTYWFTAAGTYATPPATWTDFINSRTRQLSIYATYDAAATTTPTTTTSAASSVGTSTATLNGVIVADGNATITQHGFAFGTVSTLSGGDTATSTLGTGAEGSFSENKTGLSPNVTYYFRAYGTNASGTDTGDIQSFTTNTIPAATLRIW